MSSGSHLTLVRVRSPWLVLSLAALLAVPLIALPAGAAPPTAVFTNVTVTGELSGPDHCVWRMEATIENFRGGGKNFFASLGGPNGSYEAERRYVKGKVTSFVWETELPLTHFGSVDTWAVSADNKRGRQATMSDRAAGIVCGA